MDGAKRTHPQIDLIASEKDDQRYSLQGLTRQAWEIQNRSWHVLANGSRGLLDIHGSHLRVKDLIV